MFLLRLMGQWYQQKKSTCLLAVTPITSEEIQQFLELFLFSLIEFESRSRRTCWFSLGIKAFSKTNDIFCMRNGMACCLANGSTNALHQGVRYKKTRINKYKSYGWTWKKIVNIYGFTPTTARRWALA